MNRIAKLRTLANLGPASIGRVALYRLGIRSGLHPVQRISAAPPQGPFFAAPAFRADLPPANERWARDLWWFDWFAVDRANGPPDWHRTPFSNGANGNDSSPWWTIPDFIPGVDVKGFWELSRFGWLIALATQAAHGDIAALRSINAWLASWSAKNPPYLGVNWKCGQEASLRVLHLAAAAIVLDQDRTPEDGLLQILAVHLKRIAPTMSYAIGQDNNHGTSEAAAMFIGGSWLASHRVSGAERWAKIGRRWLEDRAQGLIAEDGSFSQYSLVYHRLMLDTYGLAEIWRRRQKLRPFSDGLYRRLSAATTWLSAMVDRDNGDVPNLGANDGARILPLTPTDYRDFRPSLQSASALFQDKRAIADAGPWDDQLRWLGVPLATAPAPAAASAAFDDGGFHVLRVGNARAYIRYPRFRFRPSQADLLHVDLWSGSINLLRDAGTYSYNPPSDGVVTDHAGTGAHNTVQFDGRDQMPRLGRFLFGAWPQALDVEYAHGDDAATFAAGFVDHAGVKHHRRLVLRDNGFTCTDTISGAFECAVVRWRLAPGACRIDGNTVTSESGLRLVIAAATGECVVRQTAGRESRYYLQHEDIPVIEIVVTRPGQIVTTGSF